MKEILKFVVLFLISYGLLIYISNLNHVQSIINTAFRNSVEFTVQSALPEAFIETQNYPDADQKIDYSVFHIVYGNPAVIKAEKDFATKQRLKEYRISTFSKQLFIFHILTVPLIFLISIFLATPMTWKTKLKSLGISLLLLILLILGKCVLLVLYFIADSKIGIYSLSDSTFSIVYRMAMVLTLGFSIIFCFCLWLFLGFRNSLFSSQFNNFIKSFQK